jgi:hypothetical protein
MGIPNPAVDFTIQSPKWGHFAETEGLGIDLPESSDLADVHKPQVRRK